MKTKLTLRLDADLIDKAKAWARSRRVSLSQAVATFFAQLPDRKPPSRLSPWTQRLAGAARADGRAATDEELRRGYHDHLESKHR